MDNQLELVAKSYDTAIELGGKGVVDPYRNLPGYITDDPDFFIYQLQIEGETEGLTSSVSCIVRDYLSPAAGMKFIDLGCCLNLMFRGYGEWPSTYYGVDISGKTIGLLEEFAAKNAGLNVGSLYCGSIHETPYEADFFDIGACIGVLEYFERDFAERAIKEARRIIKPGGRFVLDIPNLGAPACRIMMLVEEYMGRPDKFDMRPLEFENMIKNYFYIDASTAADDGAMGIMYCLRRKE
ncbi:MAG: class I SAM-dependent methyltransferase [Defluviitaleaceae bacterium]|nr:class I SAM-dependent methyltransferase [Defluviitaleaceae bacterium]